MWKYEHNIETEASPEAIYRVYSDVTTWPLWDEGIARVTLDGPFAAGTKGALTPMGQESLAYRIVEAQPNIGFVDETELPDVGIVLHFAHTLTPLDGSRTRITHRVTITGPAADTLGPQMGMALTAGIPETMAALARRALEASSLPEAARASRG